MYKNLSTAVVLASGAVGCAGVHYRELPYHAADETPQVRAANDTGNGIRYYESAPYLLVYSDGRNGLSWEVRYLPDLTRKMTAEPYNFAASVGTTWTFKNGVLTTSKDTSDATVVPKAILAAAEKAMSAISIASLPDTKQPDTPAAYYVPAPRIYKIVQHGMTVTFESKDNGGDTIQVSLLPEDEK